MEIPEYLNMFSNQGLGTVHVKFKSHEGSIRSLAFSPGEISSIVDSQNNTFFQHLKFDDYLFKVLKYEIHPENRELIIFAEPVDNLSENNTKEKNPNTIGLLSRERLLKLRDEYLSLVRLEVDEFGVFATETRHLIGRLGEFECALLVNGTLSHIANQQGFDVIAENGRKISVKTTSQKAGFVAISKNTFNRADDLMVLQYNNSKLEVLYYGCIKKAIESARFYAPSGTYELDLTKARFLQLA